MNVTSCQIIMLNRKVKDSKLAARPGSSEYSYKPVNRGCLRNVSRYKQDVL